MIRIRTRIRVFALAASALASGAVSLFACSESDPRPSFGEQPDVKVESEASLPPVDDGGSATSDADAGANPNYDASDEAIVCASTPCVTQLVAGDRHFCALLSGGTVQCWGLDYRGSLGRGDGDAGSSPRPVVGITNATQISTGTGASTTCARTSDGHVQCWGDNGYGQLGLQAAPDITRDNNAHPTPSAVALEAEIARVDIGQSSGCAIATDGKVYCWGLNDTKQLARPDANSFYEGSALAEVGAYELTRTALTQYWAFGITKDGLLLGWGRVSGRDSSLSGNEGSPLPVPLPSLHDVASFATGSAQYGNDVHHCAIADGRVHCWGTNKRGVLGTGVPDDERLPAFAGILTDSTAWPQQLALAANRTCVRMTNGTIQCCGDDTLAQLGRGKAGTFASVFGRATAFEEHAVQVATSSNTTCALVQGGKVVCWGGNANGELGQGTADPDAHPTPVTVVFE
jgi:alpha-tubulin suppressor-like RCC1 family protein